MIEAFPKIDSWSRTPLQMIWWHQMKRWRVLDILGSVQVTSGNTIEIWRISLFQRLPRIGSSKTSAQIKPEQVKTCSNRAETIPNYGNLTQTKSKPDQKKPFKKTTQKCPIQAPNMLQQARDKNNKPKSVRCLEWMGGVQNLKQGPWRSPDSHLPGSKRWPIISEKYCSTSSPRFWK